MHKKKWNIVEFEEISLLFWKLSTTIILYSFLVAIFWLLLPVIFLFYGICTLLSTNPILLIPGTSIHVFFNLILHTPINISRL